MKSNNIIKNSIIYFIGTALSKLVIVVMLPLYTNYVSPTGYGYYDLMITTMSVILPIAFMSVWDGILRYMFDQKSIESKKKIFLNGLYITLMCGIIFTLAFLLFNGIFVIKYPILIYIYSILHVLLYIYQYAARAIGKNIIFALSGIILALTTVIFNIIFLIFLNIGEVSIYISLCLSNLVTVIYLIIGTNILRLQDIVSMDMKLSYQITKYSWPLTINAISYWLITACNRYIVLFMLGSEYNGYYAAALKLGAIISIFTTVFSSAWQESAFNNASSEKRGIYYSLMLEKYFNFLGGIILMLIPATLYIFPYLIGNNFDKALNLIPLIYLFSLVNAIFNYLGTIFCAEKNTKDIFTSTIYGSVLNILFVVIIIKNIGLIAAPLGMILGLLAASIARIRKIKSLIDFKVKYRPLIRFILLYTFALFGFYSKIILLNIFIFMSYGIIFIILNYSIIERLLLVGLRFFKIRKKDKCRES